MLSMLFFYSQEVKEKVKGFVPPMKLEVLRCFFKIDLKGIIRKLQLPTETFLCVKQTTATVCVSHKIVYSSVPSI